MVNEDNICGCGREIEEARVEFGFKNCSVCAHSGADVPRPKGRMVYSHKTGAEIEILSDLPPERKTKYIIEKHPIVNPVTTPASKMPRQG